LVDVIVGVLALQGGFAAHSSVIESLGAGVREVRTPEDLIGLDALVLPGGESTTMTLGIEREQLQQPITDFVQSGRPVLATCAGAIILDDAHMRLLDISCKRNAYGSQQKSFESDLAIDGITGDAFRGVFIRAPRITRIGEGVEVLASFNDEPVVIREENITALTFHPELTPDNRIHRMFLESVPHTNVAAINKHRNKKRKAA
jgi:5'-phosphate synthase pdxT subunit